MADGTQLLAIASVLFPLTVTFVSSSLRIAGSIYAVRAFNPGSISQIQRTH